MSANQPPAARTGTSSNRQSTIVVSLLFIAIIGVLAYAYSTWQPHEEIDATYGKRRGYLGGRSVNGTAVLAGMFERAGCRVSSWDRLSPRLMNADTIVWAPDNLPGPTSAQRQWFDQWLRLEGDRTLIYIGRDYDADVEYWTDVEPLAPPEQQDELGRRLAKARADQKAARTGLVQQEDAGWFILERSQPPRQVARLGGPWSDGVDSTKTDIRLAERLRVPTYIDQEVLLEARASGWFADHAEPIALRRFDLTWSDGSSLIVVTNGSFLLNYPLVNHEHRKLAGKLIDECELAYDVVFLESEKLGPPIVDDDPDFRQPGALDMARIWPLSAIIPHVVAFGILLCFALFPVFGRPRRVPRQTRSDFAKHVEALGNLLIRTQDHAYAQERVSHYQQRVKRESGASHAPATTVAGNTVDAAMAPSHPPAPQPLQPRETGTIHFALTYPAAPPFARIHAEAAVKIARDQFNLALDFSPPSLAQVDQILLSYHEQHLSAERIGAAVFGFGCYAGQIMLQQHGGQWKEPGETVLGSGAGPYMVVELADKSLWNPIGKAFKLVQNGMTDSVWAFYQLVTQT